MKTLAALIAAGLALPACSGGTGGQGVAGPTGSTGAQGSVGPQGPQGDLGPQGPMGVQGPAGPQGPTGSQGVAGPAGLQGIQGPQGAPGPKGLAWKGPWSGIVTYSVDEAVQYQGTAWIAVSPSTAVAPPSVEWALLASRGDVGPVGDQGPQGPAGPTGGPGPQGLPGLPGATGPAGLSWRGSWSGAATYDVNDAVEYGGASYAAIAQSTAIAPPSIEWSLIAAGGTAGAQGPAGPPGPPGIISVVPPLQYDAGAQTLSSIPADATHEGHVTAGPQAFGGLKFGPGFIGKDVLGCADVRAFGAAGDGIADDTAAIQAAINSFGAYGGSVCLPAGKFKVMSTLTLPSFVSLVGVWGYMDANDSTSSSTTMIDASGFGTACNIPAITTVTSAKGVSIRNLRVHGPPNVQDGNLSCIGIKADTAHEFTLEHVYVDSFRNGVWVYASAAHLRDVTVALAGLNGLHIWQATNVFAEGVFVTNNCMARQTQQPCANLLIESSSDVQFFASVVDEQFGGPTWSSSVLVYGTSDKVTLQGMRVYAATGADGIRIGDLGANPTRVTLRDVRVEPFAGDRVPAQTINVEGGSGHVLDNVTTNPNGGGDIADSGTGTTWLNVNGAYKLPSLPSTDPGPGSKQLWYDPADGNRVKFAP